MTTSTRWFANVNDLVGGWIVANVDESLGNIAVGSEGVKIIADCNSEEDAARLAALLNYSEDPQERRQALLFGLVGEHTGLWHTSATFHAFIQAVAIMLPMIVENVALIAGAEQELLAEKVKRAMAGQDG